ncbi:MAG TPA: FtsX-like permease family protein [Actinomycetota bacterium]|nr:FtsX-like permease family protein [Actinomycetota bacterium]
MFRATIKSLLARKLRLVLTALAVVLGVGFTAGTYVLTDTALKSFDDLFGNVYAGIDVVVQGTSAFTPSAGGSSGGGGGQETKPMPESVLPTVKGVEGVASADGSVSGLAQIFDPSTGKVIANGGAPTIGNSWDPDTTSLEVVQGAAPTSSSQVAIDAGTATDHHLTVGQQIRIGTTAGPGRYTISGIVRFKSSDSLLGATLAVFDLRTAQTLFDRVGQFDLIYVRGQDGVAPDQLATRVGGVLPKGFEAVTAASAAQQQQDQVNQGLGFLRTGLLVFGFVALFVGAFIIFNTFNIVVSQRSRELALFRALGASRRQVMTSVLVESFVVGVVASIGGVLLGIVLAIGLKALLGGLGLKLPPTALVVSARTVIVSLILGTGITVVAAVSPARRASRVAPIEALRDSVAPSASIRRRTIVGTLVTLAGVGLVALGLFGHVSNAGSVVGLGAALTFLGVTLLSPLFARPLAAAIGAPFRRRIAGKLGSENANRNPRRTASTSAALMIGLGLVAFVAVFAASLKASASATLDQVLRADLTLNSSQFSPFSTTLADDLRKDPDFSVVSQFRQAEAKAGTSDTFVVGVDPSTIQQVADVQMVAGSVADLSKPNTVMVSRTEANGKGLKVGDTIPMTFPATGKQEMTVVGIFEPNQLFNDYAISLDTYDANFEQLFDLTVFVNVAPGVSVQDAESHLETFLAQNYPSVQVSDQEQFKQQQLQMIDQLFAIVRVLLSLSIIISLFGIVNTLGLSIYERVRELGLLRAVGLSRTQTKRMVRVEAVIIAVLGAVLGLVIGIAFGWAMVQALKDLGINTLDIPVGQLIMMLILAALLGVVAAIWPARRAAKLNMLDAISYE